MATKAPAKPYCVYLTTYLGSKLPMFYIGSTSVVNIASGYRGSVRSKKYRRVWDAEIKQHPHLFKTRVVSFYGSRSEATEAEHRLQKKMNVVTSPMYVNMSFATKEGFFGRDVSGQNHPSYGIRGVEHPLFGRKRPDLSAAQRGRKHSELSCAKRRLSNKGKCVGTVRRVTTELFDAYARFYALFLTKPHVDHGFRGKNGRIVSYEVAFADRYYKDVGLSRPQAVDFLTGRSPVLFTNVSSHVEGITHG